MPFARLRSIALTAALVAGSLFVASTAMADALVVVQVRGDSPPDGKVTLTARGSGQAFSCETSDGVCRIDGVPGGSYDVRFEPQGGEARTTRAMIPPAGTATLYVSPD